MILLLSIPAALYSSIYSIGLFTLCILISIRYITSQSNHFIRENKPESMISAIFLSIIVIIFIGLRPVSWIFADMGMYAHVYNNIYDGISGGSNDARGEWLFYWFGNFCKRVGLRDTDYFLTIATIYFGLMTVTCWRLMRRNMFVAVLFCFISLSCFSYGTNGLRNGMACSLLIMAITLLSGNKWEKLIAVALMFSAYNIHHSTALPSLCAISALLFVKDTRWAIYFWLASILISAVAGNYLTEFFVNMGFDDRMGNYANLDENGEVMASSDYNVGFRVDFILYSIMPIIMAWYVTVKRNFKDKMYNIIANTYILSNAFWVMVIRSEQSNRFAYLSWFIYPLVIAYPLLRMNIWEDQDRKTAIILFLYAGFTFFMNVVYNG